jgi:thiol-disulfide isomerase/thioredoxin
MRRFFYLLKKIILLAVIAALGWHGYRYMMETDQERTLARAYIPSIYPVSSDQFRELILSGTRNNRPTLLFVFTSNCVLCRWHYDDIQYFATKYPRTQLNILMLSVDKEALDPAALIYKKKGTKVPVLLLTPPGKGAEDGLYAEIHRLGGKSYERGTYPYIAVIDKAGFVQKVQFGWDRKNKIAGMIDRALQNKQPQQ